MGKILSAFVQTNTPFFTKVKSIDETIVSDTTISADSELKFNARANKVYHVRIFVYVIAQSATPDMDDNIIIPANATAIRSDADWSSNTVGNTTDWEAENLNAISTSELQVVYHGVVRMGDTAGQIAFG